MTSAGTKKLGFTSRADMIDLLSSRNAVFSNETAWALGFEFHSEVTDPGSDKTPGNTLREKTVAQQEPGWTQFRPAPSQYWRVTAYESLQEQGKQKRSRRNKKAKQLPDLDEIRKGFNFSIDNIPPRQPLAEMNYVTTQLRKAAGTGRSRHELDLNAAVDRLSRGQFLYRMPHRARRVWGHDLLCLEDRAQRLIPYWSDQDAVTTALSRLYPETGYTVARLGHGRTVLRIQSPESLYGLECPLPTPGTLVLALTDLGTLAIGDDGPQVRENWADLGRLYLENGNRAVAMVPCLPEQVPFEIARYWHVIPWERSASATVIGNDQLGLERLLTLLSVAVRLEPELLRVVRKLLPETRDNPGIESKVWQDNFVASPNSVAADLSPAERKKRIAAFERQPIEVREKVLKLIREVRQIGYEDVWVSELLGLDAESQARFQNDVNLAEQQILSLASSGSKVPLEDYAVWLERLQEQLTLVPDMKPEVREALAELVKRTADLDSFTMPVWMSGRIGLNPDLPERILEVCQRGNNLLFEQAPGSIPSVGDILPTGSRLAQLRTRNGEIRIHELHRQHELTEAQFWAVGKKPEWVHRFDSDEYGPWCSFRVKDVEQKLRWIPPGEFLMGSPKTENGREQNEGPQHRVILTNGFWIFDTPCTQSLWFAVTGETPSKFKGNHRPVESIAWNEAMSFSADLRKHVDGLNLTLPSEAQWEYACRGVDSMPYESRYGALDEVAWYSGNSGGQTHDVGQKKANSFGLYDTLGNVLEWCGDDAFRQYGRTAQTDPYFNKKDGSNDKIVRGSDWSGYPRTNRAAYRGSRSAAARSGRVGFRFITGNDRASQPQFDLFYPRKQHGQGGTLVWWKPRESRHSDLHAEQQKATPELLAPVQDDLLRRIVDIPRAKSIRMESDCEILSLDLSPPPPWAAASGRDRYGLWAEFELSGVRQRLRWIPPGQFIMGAKPPVGGTDWVYEAPRHSVTISQGFWMFDAPVSQALWNAAGMQPSSAFSGKLNPADSVSYEQSIEFIQKINGLISGIDLRLPTEAEWEYSCRAGADSGTIGALKEVAWFDQNSNQATKTVRTLRANEWGLFDMLGNVWEWCLDGPRTYTDAAVVDPVGPAGERAILRGGSWNNLGTYVSPSIRDAAHKSTVQSFIGFRCVSSVLTEASLLESNLKSSRHLRAETSGESEKQSGTDGFRFDVFISYHRADKEQVVTPIALACEELGIRCWVDELQIGGGDELQTAIARGIMESRLMLAVVSESSVDSPWVVLEISQGMAAESSGNGMKVVPLLVATPSSDGRVYQLLKSKNSLFWNGDAQEIARALQTVIGGDYRSVRTPSNVVETRPKQEPLFLERDRDRFLRTAFKTICEYFEHAKGEMESAEPRISLDLTQPDAEKLRAKLYLDGKSITECQIWIVSLGRHGTINFFVGRPSFNEFNASNEMLSIEESAGEMKLKGMMGSLAGHTIANASPEEAAAVLWTWFVQPLEGRS